MFEYIKKNQLKISIIFTLISLLFILLFSADRSKVDNWFTTVTHTIAYPFQATSHFLFSTTKGLWNSYIWLIHVNEENKELKERVNQLQEENIKYYEVALAYDRLRKSLEFKESNQDEKIFAEVIAEAGDGFSKMLIINKGSLDGIHPNFPVVIPDGVVGKIRSVSPLQSIVQLITDSRSQFPVILQNSRTKGLLTGTIDGKLKLTLIPHMMDLEKGERVVATGLEGIFPKGFLVGFINEIEKKEFGLFQSATILPSADFSKIEEVFVILDSRENIQKPLFTD